MVTIRQAFINDLQLIAGLSRQTFLDTFSEQNTAEDMRLYLENNFNGNAIADELADTNAVFLIAELKGNAVGYAKLLLNSPLPVNHGVIGLEISRIYCINAAIGTGVGQSLMNRSMDIARQNICDMMWLGVWERNERAIKFYLKNGFKKTGEHIFMLGNDQQNDWSMAKCM